MTKNQLEKLRMLIEHHIEDGDELGQAARELLPVLDGPAHEPKAPHPDCVERVSDLRLEEIRRSFIMALDKGDPNYMVSLEWNEGLSILNELGFKRARENRPAERE